MIEINNNTWIMPSHLDASTAPAISKRYTKQIPSDKLWILDFSKCIKVDCAGLAVIIDCIKQAKKIRTDLKLLNLNDDAMSLAKAHGVEEIISQYISKAD